MTSGPGAGWLASGGADVSELMKPFALSQPTISKHLKVLERAGLVAPSREAQRRPRTLVTAPLEDVDRWLESYRRIREAVRAGETASDEGLIDQITATFRTRMRVWVVLNWCFTAVWSSVAVWAAVSFFQAATARDWILYGRLSLPPVSTPRCARCSRHRPG